MQAHCEQGKENDPLGIVHSVSWLVQDAQTLLQAARNPESNRIFPMNPELEMRANSTLREHIEFLLPTSAERKLAYHESGKQLHDAMEKAGAETALEGENFPLVRAIRRVNDKLRHIFQ